MPKLSPPIYLEPAEIDLLHDLLEKAIEDQGLTTPLNSLRTMFAELRYGMD